MLGQSLGREHVLPADDANATRSWGALALSHLDSLGVESIVALATRYTREE